MARMFSGDTLSLTMSIWCYNNCLPVTVSDSAGWPPWGWKPGACSPPAHSTNHRNARPTVQSPDRPPRPPSAARPLAHQVPRPAARYSPPADRRPAAPYRGLQNAPTGCHDDVKSNRGATELHIQGAPSAWNCCRSLRFVARILFLLGSRTTASRERDRNTDRQRKKYKTGKTN